MYAPPHFVFKKSASSLFCSQIYLKKDDFQIRADVFCSAVIRIIL